MSASNVGAHNWWVDRRTCIVMRNHRAVHLGVVQFAIFDILHRQGVKGGKQMRSKALCDAVYRGVGNPPLWAMTVINQSVRVMNRKLAHLKLRIRAVNRSNNSFYQIVVLV